MVAARPDAVPVASFHLDDHLPPGLRHGSIPSKMDYRGLLNLSSNELDHPEVDRFFCRVLRNGLSSAAITQYPYPPDALEAVARALRVNVEQAVLAPGSDDAIRALMWLVTPISRRLVLQVPNYGAYAFHARAVGTEVTCIDVFGLKPRVRCALLADAVTERPRSCVVVTDPDPVEGVPVGCERLGELAVHCARHGALLLIDAAYAAFADIDHAPLACGNQNVIVIRSFSKSHGLAGARAAVVLGPPRAIAALRRWRVVNAVSALTLELLVRSLREPTFWPTVYRDICHWREELARAITSQQPDWNVHPSAANFLLVKTPSERSAAAVASGLGRQGIVVKSFEDEPRLAACLRVTVRRPEHGEALLAALRSERT